MDARPGAPVGDAVPPDRVTTLEKRVDALVATQSAIVRDIRAISSVLQQAAGAPPAAGGEDGEDGASSANVPGASWWKCSDCRSKLGMLHPSGELRVRVRDLYIRNSPGKGGFIAIVCRHCGRENVLRDEPDPARGSTG